MSTKLKNRLLSMLIGFVSGGVATFLVLGLAVSVIDTNIQSILPGTLAGACLIGVLGYFYPRFGEVFIEFMG